jgi:predicted CoA-binding protein
MIADTPIETDTEHAAGVHTITLYLNAANQSTYYDFILSLKPERIIFNPGAENPELEALADQAGIKVLEACTLVMLNTRQF